MTSETAASPAPSAPAPADAPIPKAIEAAIPGAVRAVSAFRGTVIVDVEPARLHEVLAFLKANPAMSFEMLLDIVSVDRLEWEGGREPRFDVVYNLLSLSRRHRIQIRVPVSEDAPLLPTVTDIWPGADWFEREAFDLMGLRFQGHRNLARILTHPGFKGHPLRKDYRADKRHPPVVPPTVVPHAPPDR